MMDRWEPRPVPPVTPETAPFWAGAAEGEFRLRVCRSCAVQYHYARAICPNCGSDDLTWEPASGRGTVYSFAVMDSYRDWPEATLPLIVARVDLEEGVQVVTNIVDTEPDAVSIGSPVSVRFIPTAEDDVAVPVFVFED